MATSVLTLIPDLIFSSEISNIEFLTDLSILKVRIFSVTTTELVYETSIYPYESKASLSQVNEIIELHMRKNKRTFERFAVYAYDTTDNQLSSTAFDVIYCSFNLGVPAETFAQGCFLTTLNNKLITPHSTESLFFYHGIEDFVVQFNCVFYDTDNKFNIKSFQWDNEAFTLPGVHHLLIKVDDILVSL